MVSKALCNLAPNRSLANSVAIVKPDCVLGTILEIEWIQSG